jgi:BNR repeat-containing family member
MITRDRDEHGSGPTVLVDDLAWCWWTQPRATRLGDLLYLGGIDSGGAVFAATWDARDGTARKTVLAQLESDDHNNPALVAEPGRPLLALYSRHDADDALRYRIGTRPGDISEWEDERALRFDGVVTYAQAHVRGDEVHLFTRVGDTRWGYASSPDWGRTWSDPVDFLSLETDQETYMPTALLPDGRTLRVAVAGHPKNYERRPWHEIRACAVDLAAGAVTLPSGGAAVANLRDGTGLPLPGAQLELVHRSPSDRTLNVLDVGDGERFEVAFSSKLAGDASTRDARYHVAHDRAGGWAVEDIAPAGAIFGYIHAGFYVGGIVFPHRTPGGRAYLSREDAGVWHLERWDRDVGGSWAPTPVFEPSGLRIVRPWPVRNPLPGLEVVALALERYGDDYLNTRSHLVGGAAGGGAGR